MMAASRASGLYARTPAAKSGASLSVIFLELLPAALAVFLVAAALIIHVSSRVLVVRLGYELSQADQKNVELLRQNAELKLELATLKSPARLESIATTQLGLTPPAPSAVIHIKK